MSFDCGNRQWACGKTGAVNLQRIVRDIREPCLHQSPIKVIVAVTKMLKPEKWHAAFDCEGKVCGFQKILKLIRLGGVDPSIRAEVWEFLLGCYALNSTAEYRMKLRIARRERYEELLNECQQMHASVGTGMLAFVVGSKVMDMRTYSKKIQRKEPQQEDGQALTSASSRSNDCCDDHNYPEQSYSCQRVSSGDSSDLISVRGSVDSAAYDSSSLMPTPAEYHCDSINFRTNTLQSHYMVGNLFDFPALPVTNLFENDRDRRECEACDSGRLIQHELSSDDDTMHSFKINNNEDLIMESNGSVYCTARPSTNSVIEMVNSESSGSMLRSTTLRHKSDMENRPGLSDASEIPVVNASTSGRAADDSKVSEWLWTLHRIVVDVVRTDSNLEFYEDPKNLARMSDILAVYAWVDPQTGYCQGMSDILSPFVVLFEDDADAFWCFEMLLRRMRENFRMEGPTGVMKQLLTLWHILEVIDREMFSHLSHIGAESLHFAFRMLLVLFRRELSFGEALRMWEMMWAADFNDSLTWNFEQNCLEPLLLQCPGGSDTYAVEENRDSDDSLKGESQGKQASIGDSIENAGMNSVVKSHSFCGLTRGFWSKNERLPFYTETLSSRNQEDQLPVFCVAAVLILNRQKIIKETRSIEDLIKIFNDNELKFKVRSCIRTAVKLRRKYFYKIRSGSPVPQNIDLD